MTDTLHRSVPLPTSMMPEDICDGKCFEAKNDHLSSEKACDHKAHYFVGVVDKFQKDEVTIDQVCNLTWPDSITNVIISLLFSHNHRLNRSNT